MPAVAAFIPHVIRFGVEKLTTRALPGAVGVGGAAAINHTLNSKTTSPVKLGEHRLEVLPPPVKPLEVQPQRTGKLFFQSEGRAISSLPRDHILWSESEEGGGSNKSTNNGPGRPPGGDDMPPWDGLLVLGAGILGAIAYSETRLSYKSESTPSSKHLSKRPIMGDDPTQEKHWNKAQPDIPAFGGYFDSEGNEYFRSGSRVGKYRGGE